MKQSAFGLRLGLLTLLIGAGGPAFATDKPLRVMSLDQCADQYILALRPDAKIRLSNRADDSDSHMREQARGVPTIRPTLESAVAFKPDVVVRYWGGDGRLLGRLERDGVVVASIDDSKDFAGVRSNIISVAAALKVPERGQQLIADMDQKLDRAKGRGEGRSATYMTASGFTAGPQTLIDTVLSAAGFRNGTTTTGYQPLGLERTVMKPPVMFVLGFFERVLADWRGAGRHPVLKPLLQDRTVAQLPASTLTCPAWFAADAALALAEDAQ